MTGRLACVLAGVLIVGSPAEARQAPSRVPGVDGPRLGPVTGAPQRAEQRGAGPRQASGRAGQDLPDPAAMTAGEVEQLFDRYVLREARSALALTGDQFSRFGQRLQALQTARRRLQRERMMLLRELRGLVAGPGPVENPAAVNEKLRELDQLLVRSGEEIRGAYAAIDEVLTVRQRVRFRMFEEEMERKKADLLSRARQAGRGGRP